MAFICANAAFCWLLGLPAPLALITSTWKSKLHVPQPQLQWQDSQLGRPPHVSFLNGIKMVPLAPEKQSLEGRTDHTQNLERTMFHSVQLPDWSIWRTQGVRPELSGGHSGLLAMTMTSLISSQMCDLTYTVYCQADTDIWWWWWGVLFTIYNS